MTAGEHRLFAVIILAAVATATCQQQHDHHDQDHHLTGCCPLMWVPYRGHCYRFFGERLTWSAAETWCQKFFTTAGMARLASVHDEAENALLYEMFRSSTTDTPDWVGGQPLNGVWLGLHQEVESGPWVWSDGTEVDYTNWEPGQPNSLQERCAHIFRRTDSSDVGKGWNNYVCTGTISSFVCKMPI